LQDEEKIMEHANTVLIDAYGSKCESNDGLVIDEQNRISNATYISKPLNTAHATQLDIIYTIIVGICKQLMSLMFHVEYSGAFGG
jgi:hypothetical protein